MGAYNLLDRLSDGFITASIVRSNVVEDVGADFVCIWLAFDGVSAKSVWPFSIAAIAFFKEHICCGITTVDGAVAVLVDIGGMLGLWIVDELLSPVWLSLSLFRFRFVVVCCLLMSVSTVFC